MSDRVARCARRTTGYDRVGSEHWMEVIQKWGYMDFQDSCNQDRLAYALDYLLLLLPIPGFHYICSKIPIQHTLFWFRPVATQSWVPESSNTQPNLQCLLIHELESDSAGTQLAFCFQMQDEHSGPDSNLYVSRLHNVLRLKCKCLAIRRDGVLA